MSGLSLPISDAELRSVNDRLLRDTRLVGLAATEYRQLRRCAACHGRGYTDAAHPDVPCAVCRGFGYHVEVLREAPCSYCGGSGERIRYGANGGLSSCGVCEAGVITTGRLEFAKDDLRIP